MLYKSKVGDYLLGINLLWINLIGDTLLLFRLRTSHMGDTLVASPSGSWPGKSGARAVPQALLGLIDYLSVPSSPAGQNTVDSWDLVSI